MRFANHHPSRQLLSTPTLLLAKSTTIKTKTIRHATSIGLTSIALIGSCFIVGPVGVTNASVPSPSERSTSSILKCSASKTPGDDMEVKKELRKRDAKYEANGNNGAEPQDSIRWIDRTDRSPLVLVAPHATNHFRDGKPKDADLYTGAITELLADRIGASALTTTGKVSDWHDDWKTREDQFTDILTALPKDAVVVEIHGMDDSSSGQPVSVGIGHRPSETTDSLVKELKDSFQDNVAQNDQFEAKSSYTVTDFMQKREHSALQIELEEKLRDPNDGQVSSTIDRLATVFQKAVSDFPTQSTKPELGGERHLPNLVED